MGDKVEEFFAQYRLRGYSAGQILILNGDKTDYVYYLLKGKVKQYDVSYRGDEVILNVFKPSAFFPMSLAINKGPNPYIYEAETDIEIRQAPADDVVAFLQANPDVTFDLLGRVFRGIDGLLGRIARLMSSSARSRLLYELVIECRRFSQEDAAGHLIVLNEKDLGARAGLSRETVNREMSKLKKEGLIEVKKNGLLVPNLAELDKKLGKEL